MPLPPLSPTQIIATRTMIYTRIDNVQRNITVKIGRPEPLPAGYPLSGYYAWVQIEGLPGMEFSMPCINGDPVLALTTAMTMAPTFLLSHPIANQIDWSQAPNFGFPHMPSLAIGATLSGTVTLENCNDPEQNVTFEFRPKNGTVTPDGNPVIIRQVLTKTGTNTGTFQLEGIPNGTYDLAIKAYSWLRKVIPNVVVNGSNISGLNVTLLGGDVNNTNAVDVGDLTQVIGHYNLLGDP